jgi:hypothetical protein
MPKKQRIIAIALPNGAGKTKTTQGHEEIQVQTIAAILAHLLTTNMNHVYTPVD